MSGLRKFEIFDPSSMFITETSIIKPKPLTFPSFCEEIEIPFDFSPHCFPFDTITDIIQIQKTPFTTTYYKRDDTHMKLMTLSDRVSALELGLEKITKAKAKKKNETETLLDRKYSWTSVIKSSEKDGIDKRFKWVTEIKGGKKEEKNYKYVAEFKGKAKDSPIDRKYIFKASTVPVKKKECSVVVKKKENNKAITPLRVVEIEEPVDHGAVVLKQAFAKRVGASNVKGKKKELSPQDAAMMIQISFRAYLIRRSQVLRALRELAVAKAKLKEIRALFGNFSYRRRLTRDAEEKQKFSERIIVLLLTVDAIEGADLMVRAARRSMVDELEAMLDVVDPQPAGRLGSMKRRTFDLPEGGIQREIAAGVAEVVQMLDQDEKNGVNTFEVCL
ncbi:hypothetical protein IFM89_014166 [Coptis chinensis]|uniref:BAG domain-containing protein n=1 Tax=Coptis chinensis TaxID=261450 RepID=A0A835LZF5_9MAGN|nr:hypothetical protein IFM89_014166 [Coptis chinensis]